MEGRRWNFANPDLVFDGLRLIFSRGVERGLYRWIFQQYCGILSEDSGGEQQEQISSHCPDYRVERHRLPLEAVKESVRRRKRLRH